MLLKILYVYIKQTYKRIFFLNYKFVFCTLDLEYPINNNNRQLFSTHS